MNNITAENIDNQEVKPDELSIVNIENTLPILSPTHNKKSIEEDSSSQKIERISDLSSIQIDQSAKVEKSSPEEGFCCVMSMHDGVVL